MGGNRPDDGGRTLLVISSSRKASLSFLYPLITVPSQDTRDSLRT
jgi:hypothetical protein